MGGRPCLLYAHGGGAVGGRADQFTPYLSLLAARCGVVVFNVDYRKAPATTCPHNVLDFVAVVRHVASRAAQLGVDPARIGRAGAATSAPGRPWSWPDGARPGW